MDNPDGTDKEKYPIINGRNFKTSIVFFCDGSLLCSRPKDRS